MPKEKSLLPAHKTAIKLLEKDPIRHFDTLAEMYKHTIVPEKDIQELLEAFSKAKDKIKVADDKTITDLSSILQ